MSVESPVPDMSTDLQLVVGSTLNSNEVPVRLIPQPDGSSLASATELTGCFDQFGEDRDSLLVRVRVSGLIPAVLKFADERIEVDREHTRLLVDRRRAEINATPFRLLVHLAGHLDTIQSHPVLLRDVWEDEWPTNAADSDRAVNLVNSNIRRIRAALGSALGYQAIRNPIKGGGYYAVRTLARR